MEKPIFLLLSIFFFFIVLSSSPQQELPSYLEPYLFKADFESGSVGPWSSYPPAQDTAYDPTIWVKKVEGNSTLSLVREIDAWTPTEYLFGVRKKLDMVLLPQSSISFKYYIKSYGGAEKLIVKLAFKDKTAREIEIPNPKRMSWEEVSIPVGERLSLSTPLPLDAIAIMAFCRRADPEAKLRLAVDDLQITGAREKRILIRKPDLVPLDELGVEVATRHFLEGERLAIEANSPLPLRAAEMVLKKGWGKDFFARLKMRRAGENTWTALTPALGPGLWHVQIQAKTSQGHSLSSTFAFLVKPKRFSPDHPFLLFTKTELEKIREAAQNGPTQSLWKKVQEGAAEFRSKFNPADFRYNLDAYDEIFWLPTYEGYVRALHTSSHFIRENAVVYAISGDKQAGEAARLALLSIASWPSYVHPHILNQGQFTYWPVGLALIDFALGYDMVYDLLSPNERKAIANALYHKGVTEVFKEYVRDNRVSSNTSNWISHVTGGGILCSLAISREFTAAELEPYLTGMVIKLGEFIRSSFDPDGYYGEGYYYHNFSMQSLSHSLPALKNYFAIPYPKEVANSFLYLLYQQDSETGRIYEFGDSHEDLIPSSMSNFAFLLSSEPDPRLLWLYHQRPGNNYLDLIFPPPEQKGTRPTTLPLIKRFRMVGSTILRSGFGHQDFVFIFKGGPFFNHQHFDQGSFFLADRGELFLSECGNSHYYEDPWYPRLYIQAGGHNCPLVDGNVESQLAGDFAHDVPAWRDHARTTDFLDCEEATVLSADLTGVYRGKWKSLRRNIIYLKPRTILLHDRGEGASKAVQMNLRFHAPHKEDIHINGKKIEITRDKKTLFLQPILPEEYQARVLKRPMSLHEFAAENSITMKARGFLELSTEVRDGAAQFLNILTTDTSIADAVQTSAGRGCLELTVGEKRFWVGEAGSSLYQVKDFETDAHILGEMSQGLLILQATALKEKGRPILQADRRASFLLRREGQKIELDFSSSESIELDLWTGWKPRAIHFQPGATAAWSYKNGMVQISLPLTEGKIIIER